MDTLTDPYFFGCRGTWTAMFGENVMKALTGQLGMYGPIKTGDFIGIKRLNFLSAFLRNSRSIDKDVHH